ncbi:hypothetical protein LMG28614_02244 [Paraburkholderia ultramafica]|uniref:Uncharacterized protein n=1 Tax=Paraburkholderia ultramafica TaxID=1544867 RepID=A0A6S7BBY5_9BURK|nr:hypothetical protein [Paraburkholderia ultramafica]CAB3785938.1 hypothetical protein LMG28614_02244 [Paraburkholderia ultramafica]
MSFLNSLENIAKGAAAGVLVVTALPIFGPVGTITALGVAVASSLGATAALADEMNKDE